MRNKTLARLDTERFKFSSREWFFRGIHGWSFLGNFVTVNRKSLRILNQPTFLLRLCLRKVRQRNIS